jgi:hypothetical protein
VVYRPGPRIWQAGKKDATAGARKADKRFWVAKSGLLREAAKKKKVTQVVQIGEDLTFRNDEGERSQKAGKWKEVTAFLAS